MPNMTVRVLRKSPGQRPWRGYRHRQAQRAVSLGATAVAGRADRPAGAPVTIADPGGAQLALFKPHAGQRW